MEFLSDKTKVCGVKINTIVSGVPNYGSGIVYLTPNTYDYNYILTAKHIFQEDSKTAFNERKLAQIEILNFEKGKTLETSKFTRLQYISKNEIPNRLITFNEDFAIIIIDKTSSVNFESFVVTDDLKDLNGEYYTWAVDSSNENSLQKFDLLHNDGTLRRFKLGSNLNFKYLPGMSGSGVFMKGKNVLVGIITSYPNIDFHNETVDCDLLNFEDVNHKLIALKRVPLGTNESFEKREINNEWVDIHQANINGASLNLSLALKRIKKDIEDDWYHDPLKFVDLLNVNYLFEELSPYFGKKIYKGSKAEKLYVPKKKFTLREAQIVPFIDRTVYMAAVGSLAEKLDLAMIPNVYSARYDKFSENNLLINGVEQWKKLQYTLTDHANLKDANGNYVYGCLIEIDLLNFYDNISKSLLKEKILRVCDTPSEKASAQLIYSMLCSYTPKKSIGLPQNSDASALLASFYLNQVDILMQNHYKPYFRFMDDIRIFCADQYEARQILQMFEYELRRCHLSVNSQKTEIVTLLADDDSNQVEGKRRRSEINGLFDLEINKIARLRNSKNYVYQLEAFHLSIGLLEKHISNEDMKSSDDLARKLNYGLNTIAYLGTKKTNLFSEESHLEKVIRAAIVNLKDKPWITNQLCKVLNLMPSDVLMNNYFHFLQEIVLNEKYSTYSYQTYQIWLLLAKHKCNSFPLKSFAIKHIEKNNESDRAVIAAMIIYLSSIDFGYRRVVLRKFEEGFTRGYFQNRIALIALRAFSPSLINLKKTHKKLKFSSQFTFKFKDKDLIFVQGFDENSDNDGNLIDQLYSL